MLLCGMWCAYFVRSRTVDGVCWEYVGKRMNEQWRSAVDTASEGVLVVSSTEPHSPLYFNSTLKIMLKKIYPELVEEEVLKRNVKGLELKLVGMNGLETGVKRTLSDVLEAADTNVNGTYYLEKSNDSVEIAISRIFYEGDEALQLSFKQPGLSQNVESLRSDSKTRSLMISSITHELRAPLDGITKTLELLPDYLSEEEPLRYIEMMKECCNMIKAHIDDLSVNCSVNFRIMGSYRIRN